MRSVEAILGEIHRTVIEATDFDNQAPCPDVTLPVDEWQAVRKAVAESQGLGGNVILQAIESKDNRIGFWCLGAWIVMK